MTCTMIFSSPDGRTTLHVDKAFGAPARNTNYTLCHNYRIAESRGYTPEETPKMLRRVANLCTKFNLS